MYAQCFLQSVAYPLSSRFVAASAVTRISLRHSGLRLVNRPNGAKVENSRYNLLPESHPTPNSPPLRMQEETGSASLGIRIASILVVGGLILTSFLPVVGVFQNAATGTGDSIIESQLGKVPVFTVTDETGRPFLSETDDHRMRRGYFFIQPADAKKYLERVKEDTSDAKVLTIGLNEAVKFLDSKSTPAKSIPERFELFPDEHEAEIARQVTDGAFEKAFGPSGVPIFYIDGLGIKDSKGSDTVFPLFFEKEKLDETVENLKKADPRATLDLKDLQVIDLRQTIREIRAGGNPSLNRVVFVPLAESLTFMKTRPAE